MQEAAAGQVVSALPPPPPYYKLWGTKSKEEWPSPPPVPTSGTFSEFGAQVPVNFRIEPPLPPDKVLWKREGEELEYGSELIRLLSSIMACYGQLLEAMPKNPDLTPSKEADLELLFANMHALLNDYRAHQAREKLTDRMRAQVKEEEEALSEISALLDDAKKRLGEVEAAVGNN